MSDNPRHRFDDRPYRRSRSVNDEYFSDRDREPSRRRDRDRQRQTTYYEEEEVRYPPDSRRRQDKQEKQDMVLYRPSDSPAPYRAPSPPPPAAYDQDRGHRPHHHRSRSSQPPPDNDSRVFYSERTRSQAPFLEKHFDSSYDGIIAALAGAALGGMTADSFATAGKGGGDRYRGAKIAGGALLGAVAFNAGENAWRDWIGEEERKVEKVRRETGR